MLPYKFGRGAAAFERVRCYNDVPKEYVEVSKIKAGKEKTIKTMTLKELMNEL
jgi:ribosomal protein L13